MSGHSGSSRTFFVVLLAQSMLTQVLTFVLRPTATYRALELGVPTGWLGVLGACFAMVPLLIAVPSGQATDRFGERAVMIIGAALMTSAAGVFTLFSGSVAGLISGSIVLGTGQLLTVVGQQSAVGNTAGIGRFDTAFGYYTFAVSLGQALGPGLIVLAGGQQAIPNTTAIFSTSAVVSVVLLVCTVVLRSPPRPRSKGANDSGGLVALVRLPGLVRAVTISCTVLAAVDISLVFLPALGADRGLTSGFVGLLLVLRAVASMITRLFLGPLARCIGRKPLMMSSVSLAAVAMAALVVPLPGIALVVLVVLLGLGLGVGQPLTMSWLAESAPAGLRGRAMALRLTGNRLGQVIIPSVVGAVAVGLGAAGVLGTTAAALAAAAYAARRLAGNPGKA